MTEPKEIKGKFISQGLVQKIIESVDNSVSQDNQNRLRVYLKLRDIISSDNKAAFIEKIIEILTRTSTNSYDQNKQVGVDALLKLEVSDVPANVEERLYKCLTQNFGSMSSYPHKLNFIKSILHLLQAFSEERRSNFIQQSVFPFVQGCGVEELKEFVNFIKLYLTDIPMQEEVLKRISNRVVNSFPNHDIFY